MNMPGRWARPRWTFLLTMTALALGALGLTAQFLIRDRAHVIDRNFEAATLHARAFEDHLTQSFNVINLTLANSAEADPAEIGAAAASKDLRAALRQAPYLRSLALLGADGTIVASSNVRNVGRNVTLGDYLPPKPDSEPVLRVGPPWTGRDFDDGHPSTPEQPTRADAPGFLPVSRDVVLNDGRRVTLLAAVNGDFFINHYSQVLDPASATVDLLRYDSTLLLSSNATRMPGTRQGAELLATRLAKSGFGRFEQRLEGGSAVLTAYRASRATRS